MGCSQQTRRWINLGGVPLTIVLAYVIMCVSCMNHVPEPIATHWGTGNKPNGSSDNLSAFLVNLAVLSVAWLVPCLELGLRFRRGCRRLYSLPIAYYIMMLVPMMSIGVIRANMRVLVWEYARGLGDFSIAFTGLVPAAMFVVGYAIETDYSRFRRPTGEICPLLWRGTSSNWWIRFAYFAVFLVCVAIGILTAIAGDGGNTIQLTIIVAVMEAILVGFCCLGARTNIYAYEGGIILTLGFLHVIHRKIPTEHIRRCMVTSVDIRKIHGVFIVHQGKSTCYVVKSGQGILIDIEDVAAHDIIVNCDDPHTGVEKINYGIGVLREVTEASIPTDSNSCSKLEP